MIVSLSRDVCEGLESVAKLEGAHRQTRDITATHEALQKVRSEVQRVSSFMRLVHERLPAEEMRMVREDLRQILIEVNQSHLSFHATPNQVPALQGLPSRLRRVLVRLDGQWEQHVRSQLQPHREFISLVERLEETADEAKALRELYTQLYRFASEPPRTAEALADFDVRMSQFTARLARMEELPQVVRDFLRKVLHGTATLADLSDEVLYWCRQNQRAQGFRVVFPVQR